MKIRQFRYGADNLGYVIYGQKSAAVVDGGAAADILRFAEQRGLIIKYVTNTHSHPDHTSGNFDLLEKTQAGYLDFQTLLKTGGFEIDGHQVQVLHTPGHTRDSVCFYTPPLLVSGDTLFNGKVGRCFTGDVENFLASVKKLLALPGETVVYAGHDYFEEYVEFIRSLEPDNPYIDSYLEKYDPAHVFTSLDDEKKVNPFLRFNDEKIIEVLKSRGFSAENEMQRWQSLISLM
ncbi:MAG: MBL fold metallo-hydrolase [Desulfosalsimonas sp.]